MISATTQDTGVGLLPGFPMEMADKLWLWLNTPREPNFDDFGSKTRQEFHVELWRRLRAHKTWAIRHGGNVVGYLGFQPLSNVCGQFAGLVVAPHFRRQGIGARAFSLAMEELCEEGFRKFLSMPFADNEPILGLLRFCGFKEEGRITKAVQREGVMKDLRVMGFPGGK